jgi:hypothetical protein
MLLKMARGTPSRRTGRSKLPDRSAELLNLAGMHPPLSQLIV